MEQKRGNHSEFPVQHLLMLQFSSTSQNRLESRMRGFKQSLPSTREDGGWEEYHPRKVRDTFDGGMLRGVW